ncbi:MAG: flagellar biosynthesis protein FlhB [Salinibacter sp.]
MADDTQQKDFDPTPRRLEKAKEQGNVLRAKEPVSVGLLLTAVAAFAIGGGAAFDTIKHVAERLFRQSTQTPLTISSVHTLATEIVLELAEALAPFFLAMAIVAITLNVVQSGWNISFVPLQPKLSRISPLQGLQQIFSAKGAFGFVKALLKIGVVGPITYFVVKPMLPKIMELHTLPLSAILARATGWLLEMLWKMLGALLVIAALDFAFEWWKYYEDLKMSKKEREDEQRETEGDPEMEEKRREKQEELAKQPRMDHAVMKSDAVVTNPTHYAVALRYDPEEAPAPRVLAKGVRKRALRIKELAAEFGVPMIENRSLAHALYENVPEEEEIPEDLYPAVATILAEVYRQSGEA